MGYKKAPHLEANKKHRKGLWSPDEDQKLRNYIFNHGHACWSSVPINAGLKRNGKSCRLRWINYLRPGLKRGLLSKEEEEIILNLHRMLGNKWSQIAQKLPGRTDNEVKNYWHSHLKKKVAKMGETEADQCMINGQILENTDQSSSSNSLNSTHHQTSSIESLVEPMQGSSFDTYQSFAQKSNLPKIMFTEWLTFDQFHGGWENSCSSSLSTDSKNGLENNGFVMLNEGTFGGEMQQKLNQIQVADIFQEQFEFENQMPEGQFVDLFSAGEFNIDCDPLMYI